jgi:hypothetical protein
MGAHHAKPVVEWDEEDVADALRSLGVAFGSYADSLLDAGGFNGAALIATTPEDLEDCFSDIEVRSLHKTRLRAELLKLRQRVAPSSKEPASFFGGGGGGGGGGCSGLGTTTAAASSNKAPYLKIAALKRAKSQEQANAASSVPQKIQQQSPPFTIGEVVEARFGGGTDLIPGVVTEVKWFPSQARGGMVAERGSPRGFFRIDVAYDDGDFEAGLDPALIVSRKEGVRSNNHDDDDDDDDHQRKYQQQPDHQQPQQQRQLQQQKQSPPKWQQLRARTQPPSSNDDTQQQRKKKGALWEGQRMVENATTTSTTEAAKNSALQPPPTTSPAPTPLLGGAGGGGGRSGGGRGIIVVVGLKEKAAEKAAETAQASAAAATRAPTTMTSTKGGLRKRNDDVTTRIRRRHVVGNSGRKRWEAIFDSAATASASTSSTWTPQTKSRGANRGLKGKSNATTTTTTTSMTTSSMRHQSVWTENDVGSLCWVRRRPRHSHQPQCLLLWCSCLECPPFFFCGLPSPHPQTLTPLPSPPPNFAMRHAMMSPPTTTQPPNR